MPFGHTRVFEQRLERGWSQLASCWLAGGNFKAPIL